MRNKLLVLLGLTLLITSVFGFFIPQKKYFVITGNNRLELSKDQYDKRYNANPESRVISQQDYINLPLMLILFIGISGGGLFVLIIVSKINQEV